MTEPHDTLAAHQRLILLRELVQLPGYSANDSYLQGVLKGFGLPIGREVLQAHLGWLADKGLVILDRPAGEAGPLVPALTERGLEVATGVESEAGVQRPLPHQMGAGSLSAATRLAAERMKGGGGG
jgi:hypothetical protein